MNNNQKSIAKSTILLYIRQLFVVFLAFFIQRIVLKALGVSDYGIYNVVGGLTVIIGIINAGMVQASQRFFAFEIGKGDAASLINTFRASFTIHLILSFVVLVVAESIGLWFLNSQMNIPSDRILAANHVFQATILSLIINIIAVPCDAIIIANEDFGIYAYLSILEYLLRLGVAYLIINTDSIDRLILYGWMLTVVSLICKFIDISYCKIKYRDCSLRISKDWSEIKRMISFAGFSFLGNIGFVLRNQGVNMVVNIFFGPAINAARGIAYQVSSQISSFAGNFQMAATPQITKTYASDNIIRMRNLIFKSSKYSFCLLSFIALPICIYPMPLLKIWLGDVPQYSDIFLQLAILVSLLDSMATPLGKGIDATGRIKAFQTGICVIFCMDIPLSILVLKLGFPCYSVMFVAAFTSSIALFYRLFILRLRISEITFISYFKSVLIPCLSTFAIELVALKFLTTIFSEKFLEYVIYILVSMTFSGIITYVICLEKNEKNKIINIAKKILCRI